MTLKEYIDKEYGGCILRFSIDSKIDRPSIYRIIKGANIALKKALYIVDFTKGQVTLEDLK